MKEFGLVIVVLFLSSVVLGQTKQIKGKVLDELGDGVENAAVFATSNYAPIKYTATDSLGNYQIRISDSSYTISITHLGFKSQKKSFIELKDNPNIVLVQDSTMLEKVVINQDIRPIVIKKDTIVFNAADFTKMSDDKLRDLIEHIPGLEVTYDGDVYFQGSKVKTMLVEGKKFFNSGTKLAVNNLPANAVMKIELLENYKKTSILDNVTDKKDLAMNIKLKANKKNLLFGNLEGAIGNNKFYDAYVSLFYYNPKNSIANISRINNIGNTSSFNTDYFDEGTGIESELFFDAASDYSHKYPQQNVDEIQKGYTTMNYTKSIKDNSFSLNFLASKDRFNYNSFDDVNYFYQGELSEKKITNDFYKKGVVNSSVTYQKKPKNNDYALFFNTAISINNSGNKSLLNSIVNNGSLLYKSAVDESKCNLFSSIEVHKRTKSNDKYSLGIMYGLTKDDNKDNYLSNDAIFSNLIPVINTNNYNFRFVNSLRENNLMLKWNYFKLFTNVHQLHLLVNSNLKISKFDTYPMQILNEGNHEILAIKNNVLYSNLVNDVSVKYRYNKKKTKFSANIKYAYFMNKLNQDFSFLRSTSNSILPSLSYEYSFTKTRILSFNYNRNSLVPSIQYVNEKVSIQSYNSLLKGRQILENEINNQLSVSYKNYNVFSGLFYNFLSHFTFYENRHELFIKNQNNSIMSEYSNDSFGDYSWINNMNFGMMWDKLVLKYKFGYSFEKNITLLNDTQSTYLLNNLTNEISIESSFEKIINFELKLSNQYTNYKLERVNANNSLSVVSLYLSKVFKKVIHFRFNSRLDIPSKKEFSNYLISDLNLKYIPKNKKVALGFSALNILNYKSINYNKTSLTANYSRREDILPRRVLFYLSYKL